MTLKEERRVSREQVLLDPPYPALLPPEDPAGHLLFWWWGDASPGEGLDQKGSHVLGRPRGRQLHVTAPALTRGAPAAEEAGTQLPPLAMYSSGAPGTHKPSPGGRDEREEEQGPDRPFAE